MSANSDETSEVRHFIQQADQAFERSEYSIAAQDYELALLLLEGSGPEFDERSRHCLKNLSDAYARLNRLGTSYLDSAFHRMAEELHTSRNRLTENEARLRGLIENMPVGLLTLDSLARIESMNVAAVRLLGKQQEHFIGKPLSECNIPLVDDTNGPLEFETIDFRGIRRVLECTRNEFCGITGSISLIVLHDLTARSELEKLRESFYDMVSHDLRTPLTAIQLFFNLLTDGSYGRLNEIGMESLARANKNVERLIRLIDDFLDFEKMRTGQICLDQKSLSVQEFVNAACDLMLGIAAKRNIKIERLVEDFNVWGDKDRLVQVMVNLLANAVKFSEPGQSVRVESELVSSAIEVRVIDNGKGVPLEYQEQIFERFKQSPPGDAKIDKGFGLGLSICKLVIEQHGGSIGVRSEPPSGSTFWFRLKRQDCQ